MSDYPTTYSDKFPEESKHIVLKLCDICCVTDIPPVNRNGVPITRQSKYNERKTCGEECYRISKQNCKQGGRPRTVNPLPHKPTKAAPRSAMDIFLGAR